MYVHVVFNARTMELAKQRQANFPYDGNRWRITEEGDLSYVIDESIAEAKDADDTWPPKIFIVKE